MRTAQIVAHVRITALALALVRLGNFILKGPSYLQDQKARQG